MGHPFRILFPAVLILVLGGCSRSDETAPTTPTPTAPTVPAPTATSLTVIGALTAAKPGDRAQFQAMATLSNGMSQTVTTQAAWHSSDPGVAIVSPSGVVTAVAVGEADIRASYQSVTGSLHLAVTIPPATFVVTGTVTDEASSAPITGVMVAVKNGPFLAFTDASGRFRLAGLSAGTVTLRATKSGYAAVEMSVDVSGDTAANITLKKT